MTGETVKKAVEFARTYLQEGDDETHARRRMQVKAFLDSVNKQKVSELSEAEADKFIRTIDRQTYPTSSDDVRVQLPGIVVERINRFDDSARHWGYISDQGSKSDDIEGALRDYKSARRELETVIWALLP